MKINNIIYSALFLTLIGCSSMLTIKSKTDIIGSVKDIEVTDLRSKKINGILKAQATITNTSSDTPQDVFYRCHFYDTDKFDLSGDIQWVSIQVYGGENQSVECMSENKNAVDFKLEISSSGQSLKVYK